MPITDHDRWNLFVEKNTDPYGKKCIDTARRVMELLDDLVDYDVYEIISQADRESEGPSGITGFMAGCVAQMVSVCHSRGDEWRRKWNLSYQINNEGEEANDKGTILNPAIMVIGSVGSQKAARPGN